MVGCSVGTHSISLCSEFTKLFGAVASFAACCQFSQRFRQDWNSRFRRFTIFHPVLLTLRPHHRDSHTHTDARTRSLASVVGTLRRVDTRNRRHFYAACSTTDFPSDICVFAVRFSIEIMRINTISVHTQYINRQSLCLHSAYGVSSVWLWVCGERGWHRYNFFGITVVLLAFNVNGIVQAIYSTRMTSEKQKHNQMKILSFIAIHWIKALINLRRPALPSQRQQRDAGCSAHLTAPATIR